MSRVEILDFFPDACFMTQHFCLDVMSCVVRFFVSLVRYLSLSVFLICLSSEECVTLLENELIGTMNS